MALPASGSCWRTARHMSATQTVTSAWVARRLVCSELGLNPAHRAAHINNLNCQKCIDTSGMLFGLMQAYCAAHARNLSFQSEGTFASFSNGAQFPASSLPVPCTVPCTVPCRDLRENNILSQNAKDTCFETITPLMYAVHRLLRNIAGNCAGNLQGTGRKLCPIR